MAAIMPAVTEYTLRRSPRARRVRVSVEGDGAVQVTLPRRAPPREADEAVRELAPWIERRRRALARAAAEVARTPGTVPYLGEELRARAPAGPHARASPRRHAAGARARGATAALERWYRRAAREEIGRRLDAAVARGGHRVHEADDPRPAHALGVLLGHRRDVVQLAAAARARGGARLRGRARGLPPRGDGPLAALLGAARGRVPDWREHARWLRRYGSTLVL